MLKSAFQLFESLYKVDEAKKKEREELKRKKEILERQTKLLEQEINQKWRVVMGNDIPKKLKGTFIIENITRRNVWMEDFYIYNEVKKRFPDEIFHPPHMYVLKWQPPNSYFQSIIPLHNPQLQENAILIVSALLKPQQEQILFHFTTFDPSLPLYAPRVHPASLVSYRAKNEVLKKLSDFFLQGKISVEEIQQILTCQEDVWKNALFNLLPEDEQVYHTYLNEKPIEEIQMQTKAKEIQNDYIAGNITLTQYEQFMFPDRFKKQQIESMDYPLPVKGIECVICGRPKKGVIKCYTCDNKVCCLCVRKLFLGEDITDEQYEEDDREDEEDESEDVKSQEDASEDKKEDKLGEEKDKEKEKQGEKEDEKEVAAATEEEESSTSKAKEKAKADRKKQRLIEKLKKQQSSKRNVTFQSSARLDTTTTTAGEETGEDPMAKKKKRQSFLLMHHKYCMKLGELPEIQLEIVPEPVYLKTFRTTTRTAIMHALTPQFKPDYDDFAPLPEDEEDDEEQARLRRLQLQAEEAEQQRKLKFLLENPPELLQLQEQFEERMKKFEKQKKNYLDLVNKIADTSHTEAFITRNKRLKDEATVKMMKSIQKPLQEIAEELESMTTPGNTLPAVKEKVTKALESIQELFDMGKEEEEEEEEVIETQEQ
jgi:hypothetical protein